MALTYKKIKNYLGLNNSKKRPSKKPIWNNNKLVGLKFTNMSKAKRQYIRKLLFRGAIFFGIIVVVGIVALGAVIVKYTQEVPTSNLRDIAKNSSQDTLIYDRNNVLLTSLHSTDLTREWISIKDVNPNMKWAMLSAEDIGFYHEPGINVFSILRAGLNDTIFHQKGENFSGGSTISQQLVKVAVLKDNTQSIQRKLEEAIVTLQLEREYSKDDILEAYLNIVSFGSYGSNISGIKVAAKDYFNTDPSKLTLAQSAFLAGLPQSPSIYSPFVSDTPDSNGVLPSTKRANYVLDQMLKNKDQTGVTKAQIDQARKEIPNFKFTPPNNAGKASSFINYVKALLVEQFGKDKVEGGGLRVYTTLDANQQQIAEDEVDKMYKEVNNPPRYIRGWVPQSINADEASQCSIDPKTGEILTLVGSPPSKKESFDFATGGSGIQPGSSLKPFLYMSAFKNLGMSPSTFMPDIKISINGYKTNPGFHYEPNNFDPKFDGLENIYKALNDSRNIPAVTTLYSLTPYTYFNDLITFGYGSTLKALSPDDSTLSYALGDQSVHLLDHCAAYGILANQGTYYPPVAILKIQDTDGKVYLDYKPEEHAKKVIDPAYPYMINKVIERYPYMLSIISQFSPALGRAGYDLAGKTGTNDQAEGGKTSSLTFMGYTPNLVAGFWIGNSQPKKPLTGLAYSEDPLIYWADYMQKVLPLFPKDQFPRPDNVVDKKICKDTGLLYVEGQSKCEPGTGTFHKDQIPKADDMHVEKQVCKSDNNLLATPSMIAAGNFDTKTFTHYKTFDPYFQPMLDSFLNDNNGKIPTSYCSDDPSSFVSITSPAADAVFGPGNTLNVSGIAGPKDTTKTISSVQMWFNGVNVGSMSLQDQSTNTYSGSFVIPADLVNGAYVLILKAFDSSNTELDSAPVSINIGPKPTPTPTPTPTTN